MMLAGQVAAIGARVGDQLMSLVEGLAGVEHLLGRQAIAASGIDLKRRERVGQRRGLGLVAGLDALDVTIARGLQCCQMAGEALGGAAVQQAALVIQWQSSALGRESLQPRGTGGMPPGLEAAGRHAGLDPQREEGTRLEGLDLLVATHHQPQQRCLHAPHRQHAVMAGLTARQCPGACQIHAIQPVGALAGQRGFVQGLPALIVIQLVEGTRDGGAVHVADQQAFDRPTPAHVLEHFLHQQLAFAIRVAGMYHLVSQLELFSNGLELAACLTAWLEFPLCWNDRQVIQ